MNAKMMVAGALLAMTAPIAAIAQDFYWGAELGTIQSDSEGVNGDGNSVGLVLGYRAPLANQVYVEAEGQFRRLNGGTETNISTFNHAVGGTLGIGAYFSEQLSASAHLGYLSVNADNTIVGNGTSDGLSYGIQFGYDLSKKDSIALRGTFFDLTSSELVDTDGHLISLRYLRRF